MDVKIHDAWLDSVLPRHGRLTIAVASIVENLLKGNNIDFLAVTGRVKSKSSASEKIHRKGYRDPRQQMTDLSGVRIVVFLESDVKKALEILRSSFRVDEQNSINKDDAMPTDQIGYRSVHLVCDLGDERSALPEFSGLEGLKFEFQIRTVLQHAWAELAHDRNYKFSGKLPKAVERKMYLYAGMLEIADKGFDEISNEIDQYVDSIHQKSAEGDLSSEINSLSLRAFIEEWGAKHGIRIDTPSEGKDLGELIRELAEFGITTLSELNSIIPDNYVALCTQFIDEPSIYGVVRDWMLLKDWRRYDRDVNYNWVLPSYDMPLYRAAFDKEEAAEFADTFEWRADEPDEEEFE